MAGSWEFPGGKLNEGEDRLDGLRRELREELGIEVDNARPLIRYVHRYPDLDVDLDVWRVTQWRGQPRGMEGQAIDWQRPEDLLNAGLLPADGPVVTAIQLPPLVVVVPPTADQGTSAFLDALELTLERLKQPRGRTDAGALVCLRRPDLGTEALLELATGAACRIHEMGARLLFHGDPAALAPRLLALPIALKRRLEDAVAGLHVPARYLASLSDRPVPRPLLFGVSCHDSQELNSALALGADYVFLGPVNPTASHPGESGLGWQAFATLVAELPVPVYAIGGLGPEDLESAWAAGAQGIAAIRGLWPG